MPDFAKKFNIPPDRLATIRAERTRLEPLSASLEKLLETYSIVDVYGEMSHLLFNACAHAFADADTPCQFRECVRYVKNVARKTVSGRDDYWRAKLEATIEEGASVGGVPFLVQAMMEIVVAIQADCQTMNARLGSLVKEEHWYKAQMKALNMKGRRDA